jgi:hypothetical protein
MQPTWKALAGLVPQIAQVPGAKSFVWITQGVINGYFDQGRQWVRDTSPIRKFAEDLSALETTAYSVAQRPNESVVLTDEGSSGDTMAELSALTGGRVFSTDTTEPSILQAQKDARRVNYRIVFQPERADGKYHKIRVTSTRKDVKIQTADHYYAVADLDADIRQRAEATEDAVASSPFNFDAIGITATAAPMQGAVQTFNFSIRINAADVEMIQQAERYKGGLHIAFVESHADGRNAVIEGEPATFDMSEAEYEKALKEGIAVTRQVKLDAGTTQVRVIGVDHNSWLAGRTTAAVVRRK